MSQRPPSERQGVKSAERTLRVLEHLAASERKQTLSELSRSLDIPKSSLHALLTTMQHRGWIEPDATGTRFGVGLRATVVGASYVDASDVVAVAGEPLEWLVETVGETAHLGRLDQRDVVYLAKRESHHALRMFSAVGRRLPAHCTALGKAILAGLPDDHLDALLVSPLARLTPATITDPAVLTAELERVRTRGFAVDTQESTPGVCCVAVAIPSTAESAHDALSCSIPLTRFDTERIDEIAATLHAAAERVRQALLPGRDASGR